MKKVLKYTTGLLLAFLAIFVVAACSNTSTEKSGSSEASVEEVTITDANGEVTVPANPKKVVVLDNGVADTLRALGLEDVIVGLPTETLPAYLADLGENENITNVGNLKEVDLEVIAGLEPDLIIASGRTAGQVEEFNKIAPTLYFESDASDYWGSTQENIKALASIFGDDAVTEAETQLKDIDAIVTKATEANDGTELTTLMIMLNEGNMAAYGADGRFGFVYNTLGFKAADFSGQIEESTEESGNRGGGQHGSSISYEGVSEVNPDIIFVVDRTLAIGGDDSQNSDLLENDLITGTNAGKNDKIITLTSDLWYLSGGGLESSKLMFEEIAEHAGK